MKKHFIIFILFSLLGGGCKRQGTGTLNDLFTEGHTLISEIIPITPNDIENPVLLLCAEDYIICTNHNAEKIVTVYNRRTGERLNDLVYKGRSDIEILDVSSIWKNGSHLNIHSRSSGKVLQISLNDITFPNPEIRVENIESGYRNLLSLNSGGNHIAFNANMPEGEKISREDQFILLDADYKPLFSFENYPDLPRNGFSEAALVFQGKIAANSDGKSFVYGSNFGSILKFFTIEENNKEIVKSNEYIIELPKYESDSNPSENRYSVRWDDDCIRGVRSIIAIKDGYLVLFDPYLTMANSQWMVSTIYEFDLFGNPLRKYKLDRNVAVATYDEYAHALIALTEHEGNYLFITYTL